MCQREGERETGTGTETEKVEKEDEGREDLTSKYIKGREKERKFEFQIERER